MRGTNLKIALALIVALASIPNAWASSVQRYNRDIKVPTQAMMEHQAWATPVIAVTNNLKNAASLTTGQANTISTFLLSGTPDYPRNITITTGGTTANVGACTAVVTGTNFFDQVKTENFTITSTQNGTTTGSKAFKTVTSVLFPSACTTGSGVTMSIGVGNKLGMKRCTDMAGKYVFSIFNSAYETTRGTMVGTTAAVESNTFAPNGTMDGAKQVDLYFIQDFTCSP